MVTPREENRVATCNVRPGATLQAALLFFGGALGAGCGAAPPPASTVVEPSPIAALPEVTPRDALPLAMREQHVADALAELGTAELALDEALAPAAIAPPTAPRPPPREDRATKDRPAAQALPGEPRSGCETACMALASMTRSARFVCRLAGSADERCTEASARVRRAEARVSQASCACPAIDS